jgi:NlpC/P60 family
MNFEQFKNWSLAQGSVSTPINTYPGECVSLVQQYLLKVYNIPFKARGNAVDWATNEDVLQHFDVVTDLRPGDILVYDLNDDIGHIEIYAGNKQSLQQNRRLDGRIYIDPLFTKYPYTILRIKKEEEVMVDKDAVTYLFRGFLDRAPTEQEYKNFIGKPYPDVLHTLYVSKEYKDRTSALQSYWEAYVGQGVSELTINGVKYVKSKE